MSRYGHTAIKASRYTVSSFLAGTLGILSRDGAVLVQPGPATGRWRYNASISWWSLSPAPAWGASALLGERQPFDELCAWENGAIGRRFRAGGGHFE